LSPAGGNGIHGGFQKHSTAFNEIHSTFQIVNSTLNNVENVENSYKPRKSMWKTVFRTPLPPMQYGRKRQGYVAHQVATDRKNTY
ncbi:MAG: hypothetical protein PUE02_04840, partial [Eggerthellaceae bacterium]|nr:hypothetical protein [Eggerthellaceae bacterium]